MLQELALRIFFHQNLKLSFKIKLKVKIKIPNLKYPFKQALGF
jgi:hypothetical protein